MNEGTQNGNYIHGLSKSGEYVAWARMWDRIRRDPYYAGIQVCERWQKFENFYADMGLKPSPTHSLDRKENNKGYEPENCRWATPAEQQANKKRTIWVTMNGKRQHLAQWAKELGISRSTVTMRVRAGWSLKRALTEPGRTNKRRKML